MSNKTKKHLRVNNALEKSNVYFKNLKMLKNQICPIVNSKVKILRLCINSKIGIVSSKIRSLVNYTSDNLENRIKKFNPGVRQKSNSKQIFYSEFNPLYSDKIIELPGSSGIFRNQDIRKRNKIVLVVVLCVTFVFSLFIFYQWTNVKLKELRSNAATIAQYANMKIDYSLPNVAKLISMEDDDIVETLFAQKLEIIDLNASSTAIDQNLDIFKLAPNISTELLSKIAVQDFKSLSTIELIQCLNGSWNLTSNRAGALNMRLRYSDFSSKSIGSVFQNCLISQGFENSDVEGNGVDNNGNNYQYGTLNLNDKEYTWRISINYLSNIYGQEGIPHDAFFVVYKLEEKDE